MNLVVGGTGLLGSEICRLLAAEGKPVKALVRPTADRNKVAQLESGFCHDNIDSQKTRLAFHIGDISFPLSHIPRPFGGSRR